MKCTLLICPLCFLLYAANLQGQKLSDSTALVAREAKSILYKKKASDQLQISNGLRYSGGAIAVIGMAIYLSDYDLNFSTSRSSSSLNLGEALIWTGGIIAVAALPFYFAAKKNKNIALHILSDPSASLIQPFHLRQKSVSLVLAL